ncbi:MBL fold metallo-hydrolase [Sporolactobacillus sp. THM7-4]|nr:MBL fold metallo-hydrolase [Sporolactobacillus sp. THM7-4]
MTSVKSGSGQEVSGDVFCYTIQVVNVCFAGYPGENQGWILVDAGMPESAARIIAEAENRFGSEPPGAIILTHGHFDHVGAIVDLLDYWPVPVYAHEWELPYLKGKKSYPEPDATVEGGLIAKMSPVFPHEPIDLGENVEALPSDHSIPGMPEWGWIHTPGHTEGHISLFRNQDRCLIAGDAFITVRQDSLFKVLIQKPEISGPPRYLTTDWHEAWKSVKKLRDLKPEKVVSGHGVPMEGESLTKGLEELAEHFDEIAIPDYGRYSQKTPK